MTRVSLGRIADNHSRTIPLAVQQRALRRLNEPQVPAQRVARFACDLGIDELAHDFGFLRDHHRAG